MPNPEQSQIKQRSYVQWFESIMEITIGILPLMLVVLGIGMMSFTPRRSSIPLFRSQEEALVFYQENGLTLSYEQPIVLIASSCKPCKTFTSSLKELGIPFVEHNIENNQAATALRNLAENVSGSNLLPQVVLGDQLVNPAPYSVKVALRRFKRSAASP